MAAAARARSNAPSSTRSAFTLSCVLVRGPRRGTFARPASPPINSQVMGLASWKSCQARAAAIKKMVSLLEKEGVAYDVAGYRDAPPGLRIWGGATVDNGDIAALLPWLDWAFSEVRG